MVLVGDGVPVDDGSGVAVDVSVGTVVPCVNVGTVVPCVNVAVGAVPVAVGVRVWVLVGVSLVGDAGVSDGVTPTVGVVLGVGVALSFGFTVAVVVGVSLGVGDSAGWVRRRTTAVTSAMLTRSSPLTSAVSQVLGPKMMAITASMSAASSCPLQLASPCTGAPDCATLAVAESATNSSAVPRDHIR